MSSVLLDPAPARERKSIISPGGLLFLHFSAYCLRSGCKVYQISKAYNGENWIYTAWRHKRPLGYVRSLDEALSLCDESRKRDGRD